MSFALSWPHLLAVWRTGTYFDTDDAMRMVQVRDWLAGQGWFDLREARIDPPHGLIMHWSRLVDLPLGLLIRAFGLVTAGSQADLLARTVFPLGCQLLLITAFIHAAEALCGPTARLPGVVLIVLSGAQYGQFPAGRIDHHAPQIVLLIAMVAALASGLRTRNRLAAGLAAIFMAVSMGISLENLPFIGVMIVSLVVAWIIEGDALAGVARAFGLALASAVIGVYGATVAPARWLVVVPDALSAGHVALAAVGGCCLAVLAARSRLMSTCRRRLAAAAILGGGPIALVLLACPHLAASPYAAIDPIVRAVWLEHVTEAMPLLTVMTLHPQAATLIVVPALLGLVAASCAASRGDPAWCMVAALIVAGLVGTCWEVRVASALTPMSLLGGVWASVRCARLRPAAASLVALACACAFTPVAWALVPVPDEAPAVRQAADHAAACRDADALASLAVLPPGLVFAPIDIGSHLLVHTAVSVIGAPYHRNKAGNRTVINGFLALPAQAAAIVRATGARYLVVCPGETQLAALAETAPEGLAAHLLAGDIPAWLRPVRLSGQTVYRVFAVMP